jgi:hypothetical protein
LVFCGISVISLEKRKIFYFKHKKSHLIVACKLIE